MEEKDGAFVLGWRGEEHGVIAVGMHAADDAVFDAQALGADGHAAIATDADRRGPHAPGIRPSGLGRVEGHPAAWLPPEAPGIRVPVFWRVRAVSLSLVALRLVPANPCPRRQRRSPGRLTAAVR